MTAGWVGRDARELCALTGEQDPARAMERLARDLLDRADLTSPPFPPEVLASFQGVREIRQVEMAGAGRLVPTGSGLVIEVNRAHSLGRQNFTAMHEIAHTLLPSYRGEPVFDLQTETYDSPREEERLCDIGAAALLLDQRRLRSHAAEAGPSIALLAETATLFQASLEAVARQMAALDLWPVAFVLWEMGYRKDVRPRRGQLALGDLPPPDPTLRVARCYRSPSFHHFIPPNKSAETNSLVARCDANQPLTKGVERFPFKPGGVLLACENAFVPYRRGADHIIRVLSALVLDLGHVDRIAVAASPLPFECF